MTRTLKLKLRVASACVVEGGGRAWRESEGELDSVRKVDAVVEMVVFFFFRCLLVTVKVALSQRHAEARHCLPQTFPFFQHSGRDYTALRHPVTYGSIRQPIESKAKSQNIPISASRQRAPADC